MPRARFPFWPLFCLLLALIARECRGDAFPRDVLAASGLPAERVQYYSASLDRLGGELLSRGTPSGDLQARTEAIHDFLHRRVLTGSYRADASDVAVALDGGAFNCVSVTALFLILAERSGLQATAVSTPGHVWCRVRGSRQTIDIETTCRDWFAIRERWHGVPTDRVSEAMAEHRRRVAVGRELSRRELLAVFHFNHGVTLLRRGQFQAAAEANLRALVLDCRCRPACENFAYAVGQQFQQAGTPRLSHSRILWRLLAMAWRVQARNAASAADSVDPRAVSTVF